MRLLDQHQDIQNSLNEINNSLSIFEQLEGAAREESNGDEELYKQFIEKGNEQKELLTKEKKALETKLEQSLKAIRKKMESILGTRLQISKDVLLELEDGSTTLSDATQKNKISLMYDIEDKKADEAAELFSILTTELTAAQSLPIIQAIASAQINKALKGKTK